MAVRLEFRSFVCSIMFLGLEQNSFFFFSFFFWSFSCQAFLSILNYTVHGILTFCSFMNYVDSITGYEIFERMAYYGIASNLVIYLTDKLHEGTVESSNNVTNWIGTVWMTPLLGAYIADTFLGRYWTFIIASAIYLAVIPLISFELDSQCMFGTHNWLH